MKSLAHLHSTQAAMLLFFKEIYMPWANRYGEIAVEMTNEIFIHFQISEKSVTNNMRNVGYNRKI